MAILEKGPKDIGGVRLERLNRLLKAREVSGRISTESLCEEKDDFGTCNFPEHNHGLLESEELRAKENAFFVSSLCDPPRQHL